MKYRAIAVLFGATLLSGCATASFRAPIWPCKVKAVDDSGKGGARGSGDVGSSCSFDSTASDREIDTVSSYLRANIAKFDQLIADAETGKVITEFPVIGAAIGGGTALALGSSAKVGIVAAGIGALGTSTAAWMKPRDRVNYIVQAREATVCVLREQTQLAIRAQATSLANYSGTARAYSAGTFATDYPAATAQISNSGALALATSDEIVSKLKTRLAGVGTAPDYASILEDLKKKQGQASDDVTSDKAFFAAKVRAAAPVGNPSDQDLLYVLEYPLRLQTCASKII